MANQEQLDVIKQGVQAWNQWRDEHLEIRQDLRNATLIGAKLSFANLSFALQLHLLLQQ